MKQLPKTTKRTHTFPKKIYDRVEREADKRLIGEPINRRGKKTKGSYSRDIICIALKTALDEIEKMTDEEYRQAAERSWK